MSYSRWSNSTWYTFNAVSDAKGIDDEIFEIMMALSSPSLWFTYRQIKDDIDGCIDKVKVVAEREIKVNVGEYDELKIYMENFIKDMENDLANWKTMEADKAHLLKLKLIRLIKNEAPCDYCKYVCTFSYCPYYNLKRNGG